MNAVELKIKKHFERQQANEIKGQYVTELDLQNRNWTAEMIENSKQWALSRGLHRTSPVHGKEEWKIPLEESFSFTTTHKESVEAEGSMDVEDRTTTFMLARCQ